MITTPETYIVAPTDFKLRLHCDGDSFDPTTDFLELRFSVGDAEYEVVNDPTNETHTHCKIYNGDLVVIFEHYPFISGRLSYRAHFRKADADFSDGTADIYIKETPTNIHFVK